MNYYQTDRSSVSKFNQRGTHRRERVGGLCQAALVMALAAPGWAPAQGGLPFSPPTGQAIGLDALNAQIAASKEREQLAEQRRQEALDAAQTGERLVFPAGADVPWASDAALTDSDPDFAWRKTWTESPNWGGRIGYVDSDGVLRVKMRYYPEGTPGANWVVVAKDVADVQLMDWRISVHKRDGSLWFAQGPLNTPLEKIDEHVGTYQMSLVDIGTLSDAGVFKISGGDRARTVAHGVKAMQVLHTGRIGVLGNDGSLWISEGGRALNEADAYRRVASDVKAFQLEREWVAVVANDKAATLSLAKGEGRQPLEFTPVAQKIVDFEMEIEVTFSEDFPGKIHLAAIDRSGKLLVGDAERPIGLRLEAEKAAGTVTRISWAGAQLAVLDPAGGLRIAERQANGDLAAFTAFGQVSDYKLGVERTLLLERRSGTLTQVNPRVSNDAKNAGNGDSGTVAGLDPSSEAPLFATKQAAPVSSFELTSLRPDFGRRAAALVTEDTKVSRQPFAFATSADIAQNE